MEQKRTQKRTKGTEKKKTVFFNSRVTKNRKKGRKKK